jgi:phosphatidylinositol-3-phosphatase
MKGKPPLIVATLLFVGIFLGAIYLSGHKHRSINITSSPSNTTLPTQNITKTQTTALTHIFIIVEENKPYQSVIGNPAAPYINSLASQYALANMYSAVAHPSLPNYLALTSGSTQGFTTDCNPPDAGCEISATNIADEIEHSGRTWKEYAESMPITCGTSNSGKYATKHNPFVYYSDVINNLRRCNSHVVPFSRMQHDLTAVKTTPDFAFITPNLCSDMHDCSIATGDAWLSKYVPKILGSQAFADGHSVVIITWDEGESSDNRVLTLFAGPAVKQRYQSSAVYNHYSLLRTIESQWLLPTMTSNDSNASPMNDFFK